MSDIDLTVVPLTAEQHEKWSNTVALMQWTAPGFKYILYKLLTNNPTTEGIMVVPDFPAVAGTDGLNIFINPEKFFAKTLPERVFVLAHEIVHDILDDPAALHRCSKTGRVPMHDGTHLPFNENKFQQAMDLRINATLVESHIGRAPSDAFLDTMIGKSTDSVYDIYRRLYEDNEGGDNEGGDNEGSGEGQDPGQQQGQGQGKGQGKAGFDQLLPPGQSTGQTPQQAMSQRNPQKWAVEMAAAQTLDQMRTQGHMPGALQRLFDAILQPEIPWTEHIQAVFNRRVGSGSYDWRRPDRRFITRDLWMPGRSGHGAGWIAVWGDTSGSIGTNELQSYIGELAGIIEDVRPRRLSVAWCDAKIHRIDELEDACDLASLKAKGVGGGGGTNIKPVFDWLATHIEAPDIFIGFTDGELRFPPEPTFPVVWASVREHKYPYGEMVRINKRCVAA